MKSVLQRKKEDPTGGGLHPGGELKWRARHLSGQFIRGEIFLEKKGGPTSGGGGVSRSYSRGKVVKGPLFERKGDGPFVQGEEERGGGFMPSVQGNRIFSYDWERGGERAIWARRGEATRMGAVQV